MPPSKRIPDEVRASAEELLERFNREQLGGTGITYIFRTSSGSRDGICSLIGRTIPG
jgi:hypothetical protein